MEDSTLSRSDHDLLIKVATTLETNLAAQTTTLSEIKESLKGINSRCDDQETKIRKNESGVQDLNTRWRLMVGVVGFVIVALIAIAGVVAAYMR